MTARRTTGVWRIWLPSSSCRSTYSERGIRRRRGGIELTSDSGGPFWGIVDVCQGAAQCSAARSLCFNGSRCTSGVAYDDGFDSLVLAASVSVGN